MASPRPMKRVKAALAAEVCARYALREDARALLSPTTTPREFLEALETRGQYASALSFLAHALPPREAVWWGCLCLRQASTAALPPAEAEALKVVAEWVLDPVEERRKAAAALAESAGVDTPTGCLATAVAWTGGSLSPASPKVPVVVPGPDMPSKAVAGGVLLASARAEPSRIAGVQRAFVGLGVGVAEGRFVWPEAKPRARRATWGA